MSRKALNSERGFTLIELLTVMAIIGILSTILISSVGETRTKSNVASNQQSGSALDSAVVDFVADQDDAEVITDSTVTVTAEINSDNGTSSSTVQQISSRNPEKFITANPGDADTAVYNNEFPTSGATTDGVVVNVVLLDSDGNPVSRDDFLAGHTAIDVASLEELGFLTDTLESATSLVDDTFHNVLWTFAKIASSDSDDLDARRIEAFRLITAHLGKSREQSFSAEEERIRSAVNAFFSAPENTRFIGLRQYPLLLGNGQTDELSLTIISSSTDLTDQGNPFVLGVDIDGDDIVDPAIWNPLGGTQGAELSTLWTDRSSGLNIGNTLPSLTIADGVRTVSSGSADTWTTVSVTRGGVSYTTDARYYIIDFEALIAGGHLQSIPQSAGTDHTPLGSEELYDGSYIWCVDETGEIRALFSSLPSFQGFFPGVFP